MGLIDIKKDRYQQVRYVNIYPVPGDYGFFPEPLP